MSKRKTKQIFKLTILTCTFISLFFIPWPLLKAKLTPLPQTIQEQVNLSKDYGFDGIIVCVNKKGRESEFYTSGFKNRESQTPTDPHALFKIGSVGKLYTAVSITKLAYQNRISLDETLADYFPEFIGRIENANAITLRMMVRHRSGIPDYTRTPEYWAHPKETDKERLELVLDTSSDFIPDKRFSYSNTNYLLLSKIIEKVTGENKIEFIKKEILNPLKLNNTFGSIKNVNLENVMSGYYVGYENDLKTDDNGIMLATADDLSKFIRALNDGSVFKNKIEHDMYTSLYEYEHTGMMPGYQTIAKYHKEIDAVIIQFTNTTDFDGYHWSLSEIMYTRVLKIIHKTSEAK